MRMNCNGRSQDRATDSGCPAAQARCWLRPLARRCIRSGRLESWALRSVGRADPSTSMTMLVRVLAWTALMAYCLLLFLLAAHGLLHLLGPLPALLLLGVLLACALLRILHWPLQLAALAGALAWH